MKSYKNTVIFQFANCQFTGVYPPQTTPVLVRNYCFTMRNTLNEELFLMVLMGENPWELGRFSTPPFPAMFDYQRVPSVYVHYMCSI